MHRRMRDLKEFYTELLSNYYFLYENFNEKIKVPGTTISIYRVYAQSMTLLYAHISNENKKEMFVCSWSKCMQFVFRIFVTK